MRSPEDKIAVVTGGSEGVGRPILGHPAADSDLNQFEWASAFRACECREVPLHSRDPSADLFEGYGELVDVAIRSV